MENDNLPEISDPRDVLLHFLSTIAGTIQQEIQVAVMVYAEGYIPDPYNRPDLEERIRKFLFSKGQREVLGPLLCSIAAIDFELNKIANPASDRKAFIQKMAKEIPSLQEVEMGYDLKVGHARRALVDWQNLRQTFLSHHILLDFEESIVKAPHR